MKVVVQLTHLRDGVILYQAVNEIPVTFETIAEASEWIDSWLIDRARFIRNTHIKPERNGNVLRWDACGVTFVESYDVRF